jgi:hypothetical protein
LDQLITEAHLRHRRNVSLALKISRTRGCAGRFHAFPSPSAALLSGGPDRDQTDDLIVANDALYQLSYWPVREVTYWKITARK